MTCYQIASTIVNTSKRQLSDPGGSASLDNKAFDTLVYLLDHKDRAVAKNEILDAVWRSDLATHEVLSAAVKRLRKTGRLLGWPAQAIRTVHGFGYQAGTADIVDLSSAAKSDRPRKRIFAAAFSAFLAVSLIAGVGLGTRSAQPEQVAIAEIIVGSNGLDSAKNSQNNAKAAVIRARMALAENDLEAARAHVSLAQALYRDSGNQTQLARVNNYANALKQAKTASDLRSAFPRAAWNGKS